MAYVEIVDLPPAPQPVGVFTAMCQHTATLSLRVDEIISVCGNDFSVNDLQTGEAVFQVGGKASLYRKPTVRQMDGTELYTLDRHILHFEQTLIGKQKGIELFRMRSASLKKDQQMKITFEDAVSGEKVQLAVHGNSLSQAKDITIGHDGPIIGQISRQTRDTRIGSHAHTVHVAPNVDSALLVGVCIALIILDSGR